MMKQQPKNSLVSSILDKIKYNPKHSMIVSISDNHFENNHPYGKYSSIGINSDLEEKFLIFKEAVDVAHALQCPFVGCGDLLDQHIVDAVTLDYVSKSIAYLNESDVSGFILLGGNHEYDDAYNHFSTLSHYKYFMKKNGTIATQPHTQSIVSNGKSVTFTCIPASKTIEKTIKEKIKEGGFNDDYNILLLHGGIQGADLGSMRAPDGISSDLIKQCSEIFDWVICGDFHKFQFVNELKNVYYCGSSKQLNLSDRGDKRGYQILDLTANKLHFIGSKASRFKILEVVVDEYVHPWIKNSEKNSRFIQNKICVVNISGNQDQILNYNFERVRDLLLKHGAHSVHKNTEVVRELRNSVKINKDLPVKEIIHKYVEHKDYDATKEIKKRHVKVLNRYAKESHE